MKTIKLYLSMLVLVFCSSCVADQAPLTSAGQPLSHFKADWFGKLAVPAKDLFANNYYVVLDTSGSMNDTCGGIRKRGSAQEALQVFTKSLPSD